MEIPTLKKQKTKELDPEEKRRRSESYKSFVNRGGPDAPGSKEIPDGRTNCLKNLAFVLSGVLESLERDDCKRLIVKYGGRVTTAISGKTNFLVTGRDCSAAKVTRANELKIKVLTEDDLLEMIRTRPGDDEDEIPSPPPPPRPRAKKETLKKSTSTSSTASTIPKASTSDDATGLLCKLLFTSRWKGCHSSGS